MSAIRRSAPVLIATIAGAFLALMGPPSNLFPAAWLGMAGLAYLLSAPAAAAAPTRRWLDGAGRGLAFGFGANFVLLRFVPAVIVRFTSLPFVAGVGAQLLLAAVQGVGWCVAAVVARRLTRVGLPPWVAFGIGAFVGTYSPAVFPWSVAGLVTEVPELVQLADLVGERGVTLVLSWSAALAGSAARAFRAPAEESKGRPRPSALYLASSVGLLALVFGYGKMRVARVEQERESAKTVRVGLLQPGTDAVARWEAKKAPAILTRLKALTETSESLGADLTVWPEGAYPYPYNHGSLTCPAAPHAMLPEAGHGPVLSGFLMIAHGQQWNSAAICAPNGVLTPSDDKIRLLPFGEEIPLIGGIPWVHRTFRRATGMSAGKSNVVQAWGPVRASVLICVEDVLVDGGRQAMADQPNLLVNLTNDGWFQGSVESELHLRLSALRSVESRRDMVRAVNLGPTSWVDAAGVVRARYDRDEPGVLMATPALLEGKLTVFDRLGDVPTALVLGLVSVLGVLGVRRRRGLEDSAVSG